MSKEVKDMTKEEILDTIENKYQETREFMEALQERMLTDKSSSYDALWFNVSMIEIKKGYMGLRGFIKSNGKIEDTDDPEE